MHPQTASTRVLHIVGTLNRGGVETWLMHILRAFDRRRFQMDFVVHTTEPGDYHEVVRSLSGRVIPCLNSEQPWLYARNFRQLWQQYGPYHIVHSHVHHYSGYVAWLAQQLGARTRIVHSHNDTSEPDRQSHWVRRGYYTLMKNLIQREASLGLACSRTAANALFGSSWASDPRLRLLYYGIDLTPFSGPVRRTELRRAFGIPADAFVIGHVGRFMEQKNHQFLIQIGAEIMRRQPNAYLFLVGEGPLAERIKEQASTLGIAERTIFAGLRPDVPQLMREVMDVFLFPSRYEGLPLVLLEAQAAGLPCVISDAITDEVDVVPMLLNRRSPAEPHPVWAEAVLRQRESASAVAQTEALARVEQSPFNICNSVRQLEEVYCG